MIAKSHSQDGDTIGIGPKLVAVWNAALKNAVSQPECYHWLRHTESEVGNDRHTKHAHTLYTVIHKNSKHSDFLS